MARVKRGVQARRRHKKILKQAKGYYHARRKVFRVAKQAVTKALQYAYIGRKQRKRQFRSLWIARIRFVRGYRNATGQCISRMGKGASPSPCSFWACDYSSIQRQLESVPPSRE